MSKNSSPKRKPAAVELAWAQISSEPALRPLAMRVSLWVRKSSDHPALRAAPREVWAVGDSDGVIVARREPSDVEQWKYVLRRLLMHLALDHYDSRSHPKLWSAACAVAADVAVSALPGVSGPAPEAYAREIQTLRELVSGSDERKIYPALVGAPSQTQQLVEAAVLDEMRASPLSSFRPDWGARYSPEDWVRFYGRGLREAVVEALTPRGESTESSRSGAPVAPRDHPAAKAQQWFVSSYPLLGSLVSEFSVIVDPETIRARDVDVAMVDSELREIYVNAAIGLTEEEMKFVIAHEILHIGLRHTARCGWRDPLIWNAAADYVINSWLVEMGVGVMPKMGLLYDPELAGVSAEEVYERLTKHARRYRKLAKKRGVNLGDVRAEAEAEWRESPDGVSADAYMRAAMLGGLARHTELGRGTLPAGLEEEITALAQPPIPWDVELADWLDAWFPPIETLRSFARPSRRQASTPHIARPSRVADPDSARGRTFGVVLDTSMSMAPKDLARALGAISSYAESRDVGVVRVVFCDAAAYDVGYLRAEEIAGRVRLKGRGGTVLQPAIDLLLSAEDFPDQAPILVITDGWCERVSARGRPGARADAELGFLLTPDGTQSFRPPQGAEVFWMSRS